MTDRERERTEQEDDRAKAIRNETAKLPATYTNGLAIVVFAVGGLTAPLNSVSQGHPLVDTAPLAVSSFS